MTEMLEQQNSALSLFDLMDEPNDPIRQLSFEREAAAVTYHLGAMAMRFARVERVPRYDETSRENDAEHSFMLSLVATELAATYYSHLDIGLIAQFATVHDLIELETADVATYLLDETELAAKEATEQQASHHFAQQLPPYTRQLFTRYESQEEEEARFVRMVDKILPVVVDIAGPGHKVFAEDYGITTTQELDESEDKLAARLRDKFPEESLEFIHAVRDILAARFSEVFALSM
jgi:5'-deoxynucleotidase YfbR-like HD superfamily hydrolase